MLFSMTANFTPQAINGLMANPEANRAEAIKRLSEAAGGKLVSFHSTQAEGPGVLVICDRRTSRRLRPSVGSPWQAAPSTIPASRG